MPLESDGRDFAKYFSRWDDIVVPIVVLSHHVMIRIDRDIFDFHVYKQNHTQTHTRSEV